MSDGEQSPAVVFCDVCGCLKFKPWDCHECYWIELRAKWVDPRLEVPHGWGYL